MFSTAAFMNVLALTVSFSIGLLFYVVFSEENKITKKQQIDRILSQLINFILYIWLGKILLKLPQFIKDPLAVLSYPSDSTVFYIATLFIFVHIVMKYRSNQKKYELMKAFIPVFLGAHFVYEFIQAIVIGLRPNWLLLTFNMLMIIFYTLFHGKIKEQTFLSITVFIWLVGNMVIEFFAKTSIFGYTVGMIYYIAWFILVLFIIIYSKRKNKVLNLTE